MQKIMMIVMVTLILPVLTRAQTQPIDVLKSKIEDAVLILKDPQYKDPANLEKQRNAVWELIGKAFSFPAIARRTLARNWKKFSKDQHREFTILFAQLLKKTYLDKVRFEYNDEKVIFIGQNLLSTTKALVKTKILWKNKEILINYRMLVTKGTWRVYDVSVEGISLVRNYRTQFKTILIKKTPAQLIDLLREKVSEKKVSK